MGTLSALHHRVCLSGLVALTLLAYARVWTLGWAYDDATWLPMTSLPLAAIARWPYRLGAWVSDGLPWGTHAIILVLHLANGGLLWRLARRWLSQNAALLALAVFWLHPINSQAVAYASGGMEVLLTAYALIALVGLTSDAWIARAGGGVALGLALSLKVSALPLLIGVPVAAASMRGLSWRVGALTVSAGLAGMWMYRASLANYLTDVAQMTTQIAELCTALVGSIGLVIMPLGLSLVHDWYLTPLALQGVAVLAVVGAGLLSLTCASWVPFAAWAWIVGLVLPRALAFDMPALTEHHLYAPLLALWLLCGWTADQFSRTAVCPISRI